MSAREGRLLAYVEPGDLKALHHQAEKRKISFTDLVKEIVAKHLGKEYRPKVKTAKRRLSTNVSEDVLARIQKQAHEEGITIDEVLRRSMGGKQPKTGTR